MIGSAESSPHKSCNVFRPRRTRCEPSAFHDHLDPAGGRAVARCMGEVSLDCFAAASSETRTNTAALSFQYLVKYQPERLSGLPC